jgi:hypothetical protein
VYGVWADHVLHLVHPVTATATLHEKRGGRRAEFDLWTIVIWQHRPTLPLLERAVHSFSAVAAAGGQLEQQHVYIFLYYIVSGYIFFIL